MHVWARLLVCAGVYVHLYTIRVELNALTQFVESSRLKKRNTQSPLPTWFVTQRFWRCVSMRQTPQNASIHHRWQLVCRIWRFISCHSHWFFFICVVQLSKLKSLHLFNLTTNLYWQIESFKSLKTLLTEICILTVTEKNGEAGTAFTKSKTKHSSDGCGWHFRWIGLCKSR